MPTPSRDEAWPLFCEWTESESLRRHVRGVELAMRAYALEYGEDEELWAATGIPHDLDYERHPDLETGRRPARDADGKDPVCGRRAGRASSPRSPWCGRTGSPA